ncbi:oxysterol-binding protein-related protein 9 isoform X1 [Lates japonicus]|uniref:Oxysterol-binding protein-related protein 9 isoform X1 n=1 Tax=Lates japonicus TaxID=270547 RepID=A0AAD3MY50_LATJO|nr:oxysterol-binding protein-related protein 9 isoform X1 [Lates japonicus]
MPQLASQAISLQLAASCWSVLSVSLHPSLPFSSYAFPNPSSSSSSRPFFSAMFQKAALICGAVIGIDDEDDSTFTITVDQKTFHFQDTVHGPLTPHTSSMPSPMSVFRSCMLWFYKRKGKEKTVHVSWSACMPVQGRKDREEALFVCLLGCTVRVEQHVL